MTAKELRASNPASRLARQPTVGRLTVPYMVDATRRPIDFKVLDVEHIRRCIRHRRCGVCGGRIRGALAFIGPTDPGADACFADPWMHEDCARTAMEQCPFLAGRRDWREESGRSNPLLRRYSEGMALYVAQDGRAWRDQIATHFHALGPLERKDLVGPELEPEEGE